MTSTTRHPRPVHRIASAPRMAQSWSALIVFSSALLPLLWVLWTLLSTPGIWTATILDPFRLKLLANTLLYNALVGLLATFLAIPAALALGRGQPWVRHLAWCILPAGLLMPSIAFGYGWSQFFRLLREPLLTLGITFQPGSPLDIARCIWTLAAWLWPIPAIAAGLHLRRMDSALQLHAALDGVLWRITLRQLLSPLLAGFAIVILLASQEFAIYEPTGISVVATETRMVFDSGAFTAIPTPTPDALPDQHARAAAALATALPLILCTLLLAASAALLSRQDIAGDDIAPDNWPTLLNTPLWILASTALIIICTAMVPIVCLFLALKTPLSITQIWTEFSPELLGSIALGAITAAIALSLILAGTIRLAKWTLPSLLIAFLLGGQLLAIASIRIWNRPALTWACDSFPLPVLTYLARFGWIALIVASTSWGKQWHDLRRMAALDGASPAQTARYIIWPTLAPLFAAATLLIAALSMTEVPATVILQPQNPRVLTPMIMSWVHILRYDPMIQASLLMMGLVLLLWTAAALLSRCRLRST